MCAFRERGYHATTLDAIAEQLGVRKTALHHSFPDKQAILLACHRESIADLERIVAESRRLRSTRERLHYIITEHVRIITEAFGASPLALEVGAPSAERQAEIIAEPAGVERAAGAVPAGDAVQRTEEAERRHLGVAAPERARAHAAFDEVAKFALVAVAAGQETAFGLLGTARTLRVVGFTLASSNCA